MSKWRDIESVPTHRSVILCFWWREHPGSPFVAEGYLDWDKATWRYKGREPLSADHLPPTHWMSLPLPPPSEES